MGTDAGNEQEVVGSKTAHVFKQTTAGGTDDIHHPVVTAPGGGDAEHFLKEALALGVFRHLKIQGAFVARGGEEDDPLAGIVQERGDAVLAHVGSHGEGVHIEFFKERAGIHGGGVADVAALGVGNDEMVGMIGANVFHSADEGLPTFQTAAFIEGEVGLETHAIGRGGVNDGAVKLKDGIFGICQMGGKFALIGVKPDTKETAFETNLFKKFLLVHEE